MPDRTVPQLPPRSHQARDAAAARLAGAEGLCQRHQGARRVRLRRRHGRLGRQGEISEGLRRAGQAGAGKHRRGAGRGRRAARAYRAADLVRARHGRVSRRRGASSARPIARCWAIISRRWRWCRSAGCSSPRRGWRSRRRRWCRSSAASGSSQPRADQSEPTRSHASDAPRVARRGLGHDRRSHRITSGLEWHGSLVDASTGMKSERSIGDRHRRCRSPALAPWQRGSRMRDRPHTSR